jgi:hypothetical protein
VVGAPVGPALGEVGEAELGPRDTVGAALATLGARVAGARVVAEEGTEEGAPEGPVVMVGDPLLGPPVLGTRAGPHVKGTAVGPTDTVGPRVAAEGAADEGAACGERGAGRRAGGGTGGDQRLPRGGGAVADRGRRRRAGAQQQAAPGAGLEQDDARAQHQTTLQHHITIAHGEVVVGRGDSPAHGHHHPTGVQALGGGEGQGPGHGQGSRDGDVTRGARCQGAFMVVAPATVTEAAECPRARACRGLCRYN